MATYQQIGLPFAGSSITSAITQGPFGSTSHNKASFPLGKIAYDFALSTGTSLHSPQDGKVVAFYDGYGTNENSPDDGSQLGNFITFQFGSNENTAWYLT